MTGFQGRFRADADAGLPFGLECDSGAEVRLDADSQPQAWADACGFEGCPTEFYSTSTAWDAAPPDSVSVGGSQSSQFQLLDDYYGSVYKQPHAVHEGSWSQHQGCAPPADQCELPRQADHGYAAEMFGAQTTRNVGAWEGVYQGASASDWPHSSGVNFLANEDYKSQGLGQVTPHETWPAHSPQVQRAHRAGPQMMGFQNTSGVSSEGGTEPTSSTLLISSPEPSQLPKPTSLFHRKTSAAATQHVWTAESFAEQDFMHSSENACEAEDGGSSFSATSRQALTSASTAPQRPSARLTEATTLMVYNIPRQYTHVMLLEKWPHCDSFDLLYLPMNLSTKRNQGYCFINFVSVQAAQEFVLQWHSKQFGQDTSKKNLRIVNADVQGFENTLRLLSKRKCLRIPNAKHRPVAFIDNQRVPPEQLLELLDGYQ
eukprot:TRINITY_DN45610_c0_g1_i1.p1 TRINITY_DN45610_c0_g1~~TRINITY_DN45610_c0_g1_i1.p1  ORF type:complete len:430 (+),score=53.86 TRINITY_DN45610_c0_g1_i1:94-1383(+)